MYFTRRGVYSDASIALDLSLQHKVRIRNNM